MKIFFDTEFYENGKTIELISIGMKREDGARLYFETTDATDLCAKDPWLMENVFPHLKQVWTPRYSISSSIVEFVDAGGGQPEFWAYYADYDWVVLCQLFGRMIDLPKGWPMFCMDIKQLCVSLGNPDLELMMPKRTSVEHHALADAEWCEEAWEILQRHEALEALQK